MQYDSEYVNFDDLNTTEQLNLFWSWVITESERRQATDINIDLLLSPLNPHDSRLEIRAKINGDFEVIKQQEMNSETYGQLVRIVKTKAKTDSQWQRSDQSGVFSALIEHQGRTEQLEIRANIIPTGESKAHGETISLRLQRKYNFPFTLDSLGFTREQQRLIDYILSLKDGLILVAGPVNCGKNVTLVTLLKELQRRNPEKLIATLEDPPEFILGDYAITQINIESLRKPDGTKYTFSDGLRALLRHSINYAMIGETRDADTAQILVEGARLGHGFFSTIHAQDATEAIGRLRSFGITNSDLASVLRATITQRLIKKSCPACQREPEDLKKYESLIPELKRYVDAIEWNEPITLMRSTGLDHRGLSCSQCHGKGYDGRIGIFEILLLDADELLTDLISQGAPPSQIRKAALTQSLQPDNKYRFRTLWQTALRYALEGTTTLAAVMSVLNPPNPAKEGLFLPRKFNP
jgi:type II secretory ATPase GspE/PulE/Tfp pilus assembly ATPase PilB-like protein